jgi:SAM-dependent methyltransferase
MNVELKPQSSPVNGRLWGARARDWANIQERTVKAVYDAVLERTGVGPDTCYLDVGCGAGGAVQLAAARGAQVSGIDAAEALLAVARERTPKGAFHIGDLEALPFDDATFDVSTRAIETASETAVSEAHRQALTPFRLADGSYHIGASFRCLLARP